jgi:hypothetical protein
MVLAGELPAARFAMASTRLALRSTVLQPVNVNRVGANGDEAVSGVECVAIYALDRLSRDFF